MTRAACASPMDSHSRPGRRLRAAARCRSKTQDAATAGRPLARAAVTGPVRWKRVLGSAGIGERPRLRVSGRARATGHRLSHGGPALAADRRCAHRRACWGHGPPCHRTACRCASGPLEAQNHTPGAPRRALAERWQSGRMHRTRNAAYGQPYRGFESPPLRQSPSRH